MLYVFLACISNNRMHNNRTFIAPLLFLMFFSLFQNLAQNLTDTWFARCDHCAISAALERYSLSFGRSQTISNATNRLFDFLRSYRIHQCKSSKI